MTRDFNIRDNFWNPNFPYHSTYRDTLFKIADSFQLQISKLAEFFQLGILTTIKTPIQSYILSFFVLSLLNSITPHLS